MSHGRLKRARRRPSPSTNDRWFKPGFPLAYHADVLETMTALAQAGQAGYPYVQAGVEWLLAHQDTTGRWTLNQVPGKT